MIDVDGISSASSWERDERGDREAALALQDVGPALFAGGEVHHGFAAGRWTRAIAISF